MGKFMASAVPLNDDRKNKFSKSVTVAEMERSYRPKEVGAKLREVIATIRTNKELNYEEIIILEDELSKRKKQCLENNPHLKVSKKRGNVSADEANVNYSQRKINNKFYWYKQRTVEGKKITEYIKDIKKEQIDTSKSTITFHPEFSPGND